MTYEEFGDLGDTEAEMMWRVTAAIDEHFDPPPADLTARIRGSLPWGTIDADLAALVDEPPALAEVRAGAPPEPIVFRDGATGDVFAVAEYDARAGVLVVDVHRSGVDRLTLRVPGRDDVTVELDEVGAGRFAGVERGPAQLVGHPAGGARPIRTETAVIL